MAKKKNTETPETNAFQEVTKKAQAYLKAYRRSEESKHLQQYGKELAMLLTWLRQLGVTPAIDIEGGKVALASSPLKEHPKELKEALEYYDRLQDYDLKGNMHAFVPYPIGVLNGGLYVRILWSALELPKDKGTPSQPAASVAE